MIPFSPEVYFASLADYNQSIWPRQLVFLCLGLMLLKLAVRPKAFSGKASALILFAAWAHVGFAYHLNYFSDLNFWDKVFFKY